MLVVQRHGQDISLACALPKSLCRTEKYMHTGEKREMHIILIQINKRIYFTTTLDCVHALTVDVMPSKAEEISSGCATSARTGCVAAILSNPIAYNVTVNTEAKSCHKISKSNNMH